MLIATFFALSIFAHVAMPRINRAISNKNASQISDKKREELSREINSIYQRYYKEGLEPEMVTIDLKIPLGDMILVTGVWLLARIEKRSEPVVGGYRENAS